MDLTKLKDGLPYVYVYNIKALDVVNGQNVLRNPLLEIEEIKTVVYEQKVDVLIFDFLERVGNNLCLLHTIFSNWLLVYHYSLRSNNVYFI